MDRTPFGRYLLEERIAVGGMAELFLASMEGPGGFKKSVVVKRLMAKPATREATVGQFLREARIAGRFKHHNLVQVYELFDVEGQYAIAMEHLEGVDVGHLLARAVEKNTVIADAVVARIIAGAAAGLHAAHELTDDEGHHLEVVHRDVSPTNLFVTWQGVVKVVDFGIAAARDREALTRVGVLKGKIGYMAPEQARGEAVDRRTDVYALGIVLYELLTRKRCYTGEDQMEVLGRVREGRHVPLTELRPDCEPDLERLAEHMLQVNPDDRPQSCDVVRKEAARIAAALGSSSDDDVVTVVRELFPTARVTGVRRLPTAMLSDVGLPQSTSMHWSARQVFIAGSVLAVLLVGGAALLLEEPQTADRRPIAEQPAPTTEDRRPTTEDQPPTSDASERAADPAREPLQGATTPQTKDEGHEPSGSPFGPTDRSAEEEARRGAAAANSTAPPPKAERGAKDERPKAEDRKPKSVEKTARLTLTSKPSADISINGVPLGRTPITDRKVDSGRLVVRLRDEATSLDTTVRLNAKPGESLRRDLVFRTGHVVVDVQPWADVYLGGRKLGSTPLPPTSLYEGVYALRLVNPELHRERTVSVTVTPGRTSKVTETLK